MSTNESLTSTIKSYIEATPSEGVGLSSEENEQYRGT